MDSAKRPAAFISYSRSDATFALDFARELRLAGYPVWLDQLDIPTGARWDDEVERALSVCEIFLIILTPASVSSENVKDEIGYAVDHGKRIMPVLLKECTIPLRLRRFQYVNFMNLDFKEGIRRAKQLLDVLLNQQGTREVPVPPVLKQGTKALPLGTSHKPIQRGWLGIGAMILLSVILMGAVGAAIWRGLVSSLTPTLATTITDVSIQTTDTPQTNASTTLTPAVDIAPDWELFRDHVIQAIQSISSYKSSGSGQDTTPQGEVRRYEENTERALGKVHRVKRYEDGEVQELIIDQSDSCSRTNGSQWTCQSGRISVGNFNDFMISVVEGTPTGNDLTIVDRGSRLDTYDGKECRLYFLEELFAGEGYQVEWRYEMCFDLVTYFPVHEFTVYKHIAGDRVTENATFDFRLYDINTPVEITLPMP